MVKRCFIFEREYPQGHRARRDLDFIFKNHLQEALNKLGYKVIRSNNHNDSLTIGCCLIKDMYRIFLDEIKKSDLLIFLDLDFDEEYFKEVARFEKAFREKEGLVIFIDESLGEKEEIKDFRKITYKRDLVEEDRIKSELEKIG